MEHDVIEMDKKTLTVKDGELENHTACLQRVDFWNFDRWVTVDTRCNQIGQWKDLTLNFQYLKIKHAKVCPISGTPRWPRRCCFSCDANVILQWYTTLSGDYCIKLFMMKVHHIVALMNRIIQMWGLFRHFRWPEIGDRETGLWPKRSVFSFKNYLPSHVAETWAILVM